MDNLLANLRTDTVDNLLAISGFEPGHEIPAASKFCSRLPATAVRVNTNPPRSNYAIWCPFCDEWMQKDSMMARKRFGVHVGESHPEEVIFKKGVKPPAIVDITER